MKTIRTEVPDRLAAEVAELVEEGWFTSEAEVAWLALADYLRSRPFELQERFMREDIAWALGRTVGEETPADPSREEERFDVEQPRAPRPAELGALDRQLLQALVRLATGAEIQEEGDTLLRRYLDEEISLAKLAETLAVSRFELQESFERLGVPVRLGPATVEEVRDELKVARDLE